MLRLLKSTVAVALLVAALAPLLPSSAGASPPAAAAQALADTDVFRFSGGGYGHGVGMSQYGAKGLADQGRTTGEILRHYYAGTTVGLDTSINNLRIRLAETSTAVTLTTSGPIEVRLNGTPFWSYAAGSTFTVRRVGTSFEISGRGQFGAPGDRLDLVMQQGQPLQVSSTGHSYRWGRLTFQMSAGSALLVVLDSLTMQRYLYGISEVPNSWPFATLNAQAIAARTYAEVQTRARRAAGNPFDLYATTQDQNYTGYVHESSPQASRWIDAVRATDRQHVERNGVPVVTFYFSTSGGATENSEYVFASALPHLRYVADPADAVSPLHRWTRSYTRAQLSQWLGRQADTAVGSVLAITVGSPRGQSGRIDKAAVQIRGTAGTKTVTGARLRAVINQGTGPAVASSLPSTKLVISRPPNRGPIGNHERVVVDGPNRATASGWAIDPDTTDPVRVHAYVDGVWAGAVTADGSRPDVGSAYPGYGNAHGFAIPVGVEGGTHSVCAHVIDSSGQGPNLSIGCRNVTVGLNPVGNFEALQLSGSSAVASGWVIDPNTAAPIRVHVYRNGRWAAAATAENTRPDVGVLHPAWGPNHGFSIAIGGVSAGDEVCVYAINDGAGNNPLLGCHAT